MIRKDAPRKSAPKKETPPRPDARRLALYALSDVVRGKGYSTLSLGEQLRQSNLPMEEKRLATSLFYTTLENLRRIDYILAQFVERKPEPVIEDILRLAVAQLLFMDRMPDHAVVDEAVKQVKRFKRDHVSGMVNGTLRNVIRRRDENAIKYPVREDDPVQYIAVMYSFSDEMTRALADDYGLDTAEKIISYRPAARYETVRPNYMRMNDAQFEEYAEKKQWKFEKGLVPGALRLTNPGDLAGDPDYKDGMFSMQGEAAMLAAMAVEAKPAQTILDACAAPGGKTAYICEKMAVTGRVYAWDDHDHRVELIQAMRKRLRLDNIRSAVRDATVARPELNDTFDAVLVDAPCSGLGVLQDKPDIKYRMTMDNVRSLVDVQKKILDACAGYVVPGGRLVYSTCTVLRDENERQVARFLEEHPDYERDLSDEWLPERFRPLWQNGEMQLLAHRDGVEGFYIARLKRKQA